MMSLFAEQIKIAVHWLVSYIGTGLHIWLLGAALLYIILFEREKMLRRLFLGYTALFAVVYFCPATIWLLVKFIGQDVYWRVLWLLPTPVIIAFAMVKGWERVKKIWQKAALLLLFLCVICFTGTNVYLQSNQFEKAYNWQKIPELPATVCSVIRDHLEEGEQARIVSTWDVANYIRQYDAGIQQLYGRSNAVAGFSKFIYAVNRESVKTRSLCRRARILKCNFIVLPKTAVEESVMHHFKYEVVDEVDNYYVWKDVWDRGKTEADS